MNTIEAMKQEQAALIDAFENAVLGEQAAEREGSDSEYEAASIRLIDARKYLLAVLAADARVPMTKDQIAESIYGIPYNRVTMQMMLDVRVVELFHGIKP